MTDPQVLTRYGMEVHKDWQSRTWVHAALDVGGPWVRYDDVSALLIAQAAHLKDLEHENQELHARVEPLSYASTVGIYRVPPNAEVTDAERTESRELLDRARREIEAWPDWKLSYDVREQLRLFLEKHGQGLKR